MGETDPRVEIVASILDHPSVYMGGPSVHSQRKARAILAALHAARPVEPPADEDVAGLVERLRDPLLVFQQGSSPTLATDENVADMEAAAALIERQQVENADLRARLAKAVEALEPFAMTARQMSRDYDDEDVAVYLERGDGSAWAVYVSPFRRARTALDAIKEDRT